MESRCRDCKHFKKDKTLLAMAFFPVIGWLMAPMLYRDAITFGKCHNPKVGLLQTEPVKSYWYASTARMFDCINGRYFERKGS